MTSEENSLIVITSDDSGSFECSFEDSRDGIIDASYNSGEFSQASSNNDKSLLTDISENEAENYTNELSVEIDEQLFNVNPRESSNLLTFNPTLNSTMVENYNSPSSRTSKSSIQNEDDNSTPQDVFENESYSTDIISESDDNEIYFTQTTKGLQQPSSSQKLKIESDSPDVKIPVTESDYNTQKDLVYNLRSELQTIQELEDETPETAIKPATWEQLQDIASAVQPRTFGKRAMATLNTQKVLTMDCLENLHGSLKNCPTENVLTEDPKGLKVELMIHQKRALAWMLWRENQKPSGGILADDMGLGKTLSLISLIMKSKQLHENDTDGESDDSQNTDDDRLFKYKGGTLVICPASLLALWDDEIKRHVKSNYFRVELHHGANREMKSKKRLCRKDIVITTYSIVMNEMEKNTALFNIRWNRIILDEAHQVRNHKTKTSLAVCKLAANSRWILTGTPIQNKEIDLYALLKFLRVSPFDDLPVFKRWVSDKNAGGQERLNTVISSIMLRRTKAQLMEGGSLECLPERQWEIINIKLSKEETDVYQKVLIFSRTLFAEFLRQKTEKTQEYVDNQHYGRRNDPNEEYYKMYQKLVQMNGVKKVKQHDILVLLLRLRQICCHPSLITAMLHDEDLGECSDDEDNKAMSLLDQINRLSLEVKDDSHHNVAIDLAEGAVSLSEATRGILNPSNPIFNSKIKSAKVHAILDIIKEKVLANKDKCILVSQWTGFLKIVAEQLKNENIKFDSLDGTIPVPKRGAIVDRFNNPDVDVNILLLSLTAGGVGLNLIGANHLLLLDLHWNPQLELQAQDRIYRVGQKKPVFIYKFIAVDTIEVRIKELQDKKKSLADDILTGSKIQQSSLSLQDLKMLFNF